LKHGIFYVEAHAWITEAIVATSAASHPICKTIADELRRHERLTRSAGVPFLIGLSNGATSYGV